MKLYWIRNLRNNWLTARQRGVVGNQVTREDIDKILGRKAMFDKIDEMWDADWECPLPDVPREEDKMDIERALMAFIMTVESKNGEEGDG